MTQSGGMHVSEGERSARERVEAVYVAVDRLTPDDLRLTPMPERDPMAREHRVARLEAAAVANERADLLDEARSWLREALDARTLARHRAEAGVWGISAGGAVRDQVEVFLALEDAVSVAATEDLLDPAEAAALADPGRRLLGLEPLAVPGVGPEPPANAWEPSAADWDAASDTGPAAVDPDEPMGGSRTMQRTFFGVLGGFGAVAALGIGLANDQPLLGFLAAGAVAALGWTFATWRSVRRP